MEENERQKKQIRRPDRNVPIERTREKQLKQPLRGQWVTNSVKQCETKSDGV